MWDTKQNLFTQSLNLLVSHLTLKLNLFSEFLICFHLFKQTYHIILLDSGLDSGVQYHNLCEFMLSSTGNGLFLQSFMREAKQAEVLLSQQDNYLAKEETPVSV